MQARSRALPACEHMFLEIQIKCAATRTGSKLSGPCSPSASSAKSPCVLLHSKANLCASCSRPGKGDDWPPKMRRVSVDAYLMWPRHVVIPGLHQEHTFQGPYARALAGMRLEIRRIAPLEVIKLRTAASCHINAHQRSRSPIGQPPPGTCSPNQKRLPYCLYSVKHCCCDVVAVVSVPRVLGVPAAQPAVAAVGARLGMGGPWVRMMSLQI